jgi:carboxypeptidase Taq
MNTYDQLHERMKELQYLQSAIATLQWDQEVYMPSQAVTFRSQQLAQLSSWAHERFVAPEMGQLLNHLAKQDLDDNQRINVLRSQEDYEKEIKLSSPFVKKRSAAISTAYSSWVKAREEGKASIFLKDFEPLLDIKREEAELRGYEEHPYNALFDLFEPGMTVADLDRLFGTFKQQVGPIKERVLQLQEDHTDSLHSRVPEETQWAFGLEVLEQMGFSFERGRQDKSHHPFTISLAPNDIRVTTRVDENDFSNMLWSCIHEGGHALYEQGLPKNKYLALPLSEAASLSIHESQARLWENQIGRSIPFWKFLFPKLVKSYSPAFKGTSLPQFLKAINYIQPNTIRTEADELHYHQHIIIRYEIEKQLMSGKLEIEDVEEYWNQAYYEELNIEVKHPKEGVLQDVHWAHGGIGYFPTYTIGSFYAAQFHQQMSREIGNLDNDIENGNFSEVLLWLQSNIYKHGRRYKSPELCQNICDQPLSARPFLKSFEDKIEKIYQLKA